MDKEYNKKLVEKYPFLLPYGYDGELPEDYDYEYTWLDQMPSGWRKAFGEQMCAEIEALLETINYQNEYYILQIKEKWGYLHWYGTGVPKEVYDDLDKIIAKYEDLSKKICIECGAPATHKTTGWISLPYCVICATKYRDTVPMEDRNGI